MSPLPLYLVYLGPAEKIWIPMTFPLSGSTISDEWRLNRRWELWSLSTEWWDFNCVGLPQDAENAGVEHTREMPRSWNRVFIHFNVKLLVWFWFRKQNAPSLAKTVTFLQILWHPFNVWSSVSDRTWLWYPTSAHQNDPQTPQVTGLVVAIVFEYLWRGVLQREAGGLQKLIVWWFEASEAEIYDFYLGVLALVCKEQVLWIKTRQQSFLSALQSWSTLELAKLCIETVRTRYFTHTASGQIRFLLFCRKLQSLIDLNMTE